MGILVKSPAELSPRACGILISRDTNNRILVDKVRFSVRVPEMPSGPVPPAPHLTPVVPGKTGQGHYRVSLTVGRVRPVAARAYELDW